MAVPLVAEPRLVRGIARFSPEENYASTFGFQWNLFDRTQLDSGVVRQSSERLFAETGWTPEGLDGLDILEVGSGAGRFSRVILEQTRANLYSVDYSEAVEANWKNNGAIAPDRFHLCQASIYELPFPEGSFDKVLCLGVLQHTPDFEASVKALVAMAKPGGEVVVDFYPVRGWWTKVHAKYLLRPIARRIPAPALMRLITRNVGWLLRLSNALRKAGLGVLTRFLPIVDTSTFPHGLTKEQTREWAILDTFDQYSPQYDNPQRVEDVAAMFRRAGAEVTFAGRLPIGTGHASVVRVTRAPHQARGRE